MEEVELFKKWLGLPNYAENKEQKIKDKADKQEPIIEKITWCAWGCILIGLLLAILEIAFFPYESKGNDLNLLGDLLSGTVGPLWALAGLFFIYAAFLGQKQQLLYQQLDIELNRRELEYTRKEIAGQKAEMKLQNDTLQQQKIENTFFQLLTLFHSIVNSMDQRRGGSSIAQGRDCFKNFYGTFKREYDSLMNKEVNIDKVLQLYSRCYNGNKSDLSHYFRTLYHIIKFIKYSKIPNKKQYTSIVRAQLSSYEQALLFYNCLHVNGREYFKPMIEEYALLKNIDRSLLLDPKHFKEYSSDAYGENNSKS